MQKSQLTVKSFKTHLQNTLTIWTQIHKQINKKHPKVKSPESYPKKLKNPELLYDKNNWKVKALYTKLENSHLQKKKKELPNGTKLSCKLNEIFRNKKAQKVMKASR